MNITKLVVIAFGCLWSTGLRAAVIQANITSLPTPGQYQYSFSLGGINLGANQEVDVMFPASLFSSISNPVAAPGFNAFILQVNSPLGLPGDFDAVASGNILSAASTVMTPVGTVTATVRGAGVPDQLPFTIDQFDANGKFLSTVVSGQTTSDVAITPEPSPRAMGGLALLAAVAYSRFGKRRTAGEVGRRLVLKYKFHPKREVTK